MGECVSVVRALSCNDFAKYVCNSMRVHSECSECCEMTIETSEVSVSSSDEGHCCL